MNRNFPHRSHRAAQRQKRFRALKRAAALEHTVSSEIRGPYSTPMGKRYLEDVLETMGV